MEPIKKRNFIRPRLSMTEIEAIMLSLGYAIRRLEDSNSDDPKEREIVEWVKRLHKRFEHLNNGSEFLRPRGNKKP